eukprot:173659-Prorocentrum_minimum.AAC.1
MAALALNVRGGRRHRRVPDQVLQLRDVRGGEDALLGRGLGRLGGPEGLARGGAGRRRRGGGRLCRLGGPLG